MTGDGLDGLCTRKAPADGLRELDGPECLHLVRRSSWSGHVYDEASVFATYPPALCACDGTSHIAPSMRLIRLFLGEKATAFLSRIHKHDVATSCDATRKALAM
jgi:hypothetical protein